MAFVETGRGLTLLDTLKLSSGAYLKVPNNSNPEVNDWDEDGRKDLIIGTQSGTTGYIHLYMNQGTNASPVFSSYTYIQSGGSAIQWYRANPRIFDLNLDGLKDLIIGENTGHLYFYRNVGTNSNPAFNGYEALTFNNGVPIDEYAGTRFYCTDWNGDNLPDLLTSDFYGYVRYYENYYTGVEETERHTITSFSVSPNITKGKVSIKFSLSKTSLVNIELYSADGRLIDVIVNQIEDEGIHNLTWHRRNLASGIYFIKLNTGGYKATKKVIVL